MDQLSNELLQLLCSFLVDDRHIVPVHIIRLAAVSQWLRAACLDYCRHRVRRWAAGTSHVAPEEAERLVLSHTPGAVWPYPACTSSLGGRSTRQGLLRRGLPVGPWVHDDLRTQNDSEERVCPLFWIYHGERLIMYKCWILQEGSLRPYACGCLIDLPTTILRRFLYRDHASGQPSIPTSRLLGRSDTVYPPRRKLACHIDDGATTITTSGYRDSPSGNQIYETTHLFSTRGASAGVQYSIIHEYSVRATVKHTCGKTVGQRPGCYCSDAIEALREARLLVRELEHISPP